MPVAGALTQYGTPTTAPRAPPPPPTPYSNTPGGQTPGTNPLITAPTGGGAPTQAQYNASAAQTVGGNTGFMQSNFAPTQQGNGTGFGPEYPAPVYGSPNYNAPAYGGGIGAGVTPGVSQSQTGAGAAAAEYDQMGNQLAGGLSNAGQNQQAAFNQTGQNLYGASTGLGQNIAQTVSDVGMSQAGADAALGSRLTSGALGVGQQAGQYIGATGETLGAGLGAAGAQGYGDQMAAAGTAAGQAAGAFGAGATGLGLLTNAAEGVGPSAAQAQLGAGTAAALRAQLAGAASARGGAFAQAAAQNQAQELGANQESAAVGQAAQLRAQEMQTAEGQLVSGANAQFGTAGGLAQNYLSGAESNNLAGLTAGASTQLQGAEGAAGALQAGQQLGTTTALTAQQEADQNIANSNSLAASSLLQGQQLGQAALTASQQNGAQTGLNYTTAGLQAQQAYQAMGQQAQLAQLNATLAARGQDLGIQGTNAQIAAQQQGQLISGGAALGGTALMAAASLSDENLKTGVDPQGNADPGTGAGAAGQSAYDAANAAGSGAAGAAAGQAAYGAAADAGPAPTTKGLSQADLSGMLARIRQGFASPNYMTPQVQTPIPALANMGQSQAKAIGSTPTPNLNAVTGGGADISPYLAQLRAMGQTQAGAIGGVATPNLDAAMGAPLTSDARAKVRVQRAPTADALLSTLAKSKSTFAYKDPSQQPVSALHPKVPGARFGGVMAQDLERVPEIGRQLVTDTPRGKQLEPGATLSAALMAIGRLEEKVEALQGRRR